MKHRGGVIGKEVRSGGIDVTVAAWTGCVLRLLRQMYTIHAGNRVARRSKKKQIKQFRVILDEHPNIVMWVAAPTSAEHVDFNRASFAFSSL